LHALADRSVSNSISTPADPTEGAGASGRCPLNPATPLPSNAAHQRNGIRPRMPFALAWRFELFALW